MSQNSPEEEVEEEDEEEDEEDDDEDEESAVSTDVKNSVLRNCFQSMVDTLSKQVRPSFTLFSSLIEIIRKNGKRYLRN